MEIYFNGTALAVIFGYYLLINIIMYVLMAIDKRRAIKDKWRVPEKNFYILAVLGGGAGGLLAMMTVRHKTRHIDFILVYTITAVLHFIVAYLAIAKFAFIWN